MRNKNYPLFIGSIIFIFLILVAFFPGRFTSNDPLFEDSPKYIEYKEDGQWVEEFAHNPLRPNKENIFGTDDAGRDVYARLVYGTRNTLKLALLIAVLRMLIALPLGLAAGMNLRFVSSIVKIFNTFFTAIPMLLFSFVVLSIGYIKGLTMDKSIIAFAVVLTIVGWAKLAAMIEDTTKRVMEEDFIEGEVALGKSKLQIAFQNILPHIIPISISLFFKEMGMALFLIAQLAVLQVFVGITRSPKLLSVKAGYIMSLEPEWGGTLSRISRNLNKYDAVYWMTLYPIVVFSTAIIGINLIGEGLRIEFEKRESRVISSIRKAYYQISPKIFIYQLINIKKYYKPVRNKILVIVIIIGYFIIPWNPSRYKYDISNARTHLNELTSPKYNGRVAGTDGGFKAGEYIINTLKSYGYEVDTMEIPLTEIVEDVDSGEERIIPMQLGPMLIESGWIKIRDKQDKIRKFYLHKDFTILTLSEDVFLEDKVEELNYKGIASEAEFADNIPEGIDFFAITPYSDGFYYFILNDRSNMYKKPEIKTKSRKTLKYDIQFLSRISYSRSTVVSILANTNTNTYQYPVTTILPFGDLRRELEIGYKEVEINFDYPKLPQYPARNITAFLPGKDKTIEDPGELIIIGASYDGLHLYGTETPYIQTAAPAATALELAGSLARIRKPLEKSVQFIFWDNEFEGMIYSIVDGSNYYHQVERTTIDMATSHGYYYFDICYPGYTDEKYLDIQSFPAQIANKSSYLMGAEMEKRIKHANEKYRRFYHDFSTTNAMINMRLNSLASECIGNPNTKNINCSIDTKENLNFKRMETIGQLLLDTLTMNKYLME